MRIGLLADIHEDVDRLSRSIARCRREGVDRLFTLGDIFETGARFAEAVNLLREADVEGVWGNHEFGLFAGRGDSVERIFDWRSLDYMRRSRPARRSKACSWAMSCLASIPRISPSHGTASRSPRPPRTSRGTSSSFPHHRMFVGHFHRWRAVTPEGPLDWSGDRPIRFDRDRRHLVVVAAVCDGWCAVYDTEADVLTPFDLREVGSS